MDDRYLQWYLERMERRGGWRGREDGEEVVYTDVVPLTDVVYHPITLTTSMRLSSQVVSELRKICKKY